MLAAAAATPTSAISDEFAGRASRPGLPVGAGHRRVRAMLAPAGTGAHSKLATAAAPAPRAHAAVVPGARRPVRRRLRRCDRVERGSVGAGDAGPAAPARWSRGGAGSGRAPRVM